MDSPNPASPLTVVKVGGSLFDLPDLDCRLIKLLESLPEERVLLVPGGGPTTDVVRELDRVHGLGEERAHWLALDALRVNAHFLAVLLPPARVVIRLEECADEWQRGFLPVLDPRAFALADEGCPGCLPHSWDVTSDSVAARAARVFGARRLILLKSIDIPRGMDWKEAARQGLVDPHCASVAGQKLELRVINLRAFAEMNPAC